MGRLVPYCYCTGKTYTFCLWQVEAARMTAGAESAVPFGDVRRFQTHPIQFYRHTQSVLINLRKRSDGLTDVPASSHGLGQAINSYLHLTIHWVIILFRYSSSN